MKVKKIAASAGIAGVLGLGALGMGAGLAQADDDNPWPLPVPGLHGENDGQFHDGQFGDGQFDNAIPVWAPPMPPAPDWAVGAQVVWNAQIGSWGFWWMGSFVAL